MKRHKKKEKKTHTNKNKTKHEEMGSLLQTNQDYLLITWQNGSQDRN